MSDRADFIEALGAYFVAGFNEGRENRHHDTEEHTASLANYAVMQKYDALAARLAEAVAALRELVRLKDSKDSDHAAYIAQRPAAWAEARRIVGATHSASGGRNDE